jgi:XTP/dITP diphosphohydrolase
MTRLLGEIAATGDRDRRARFVCVIALAAPGDETVRTFAGECRGHIAHAPRGEGGFGYDPVFVPEGHTRTFGELTAEAKQTLSHRARAAAEARDYIRRELSESGLTGP